jgi:hypothetical protein
MPIGDVIALTANTLSPPTLPPSPGRRASPVLHRRLRPQDRVGQEEAGRDPGRDQRRSGCQGDPSVHTSQPQGLFRNPLRGAQ